MKSFEMSEHITIVEKLKRTPSFSVDKPDEEGVTLPEFH